MARYQCGICGYIFDEDAEEKEFSDLEKWSGLRGQHG